MKNGERVCHGRSRLLNRLLIMALNINTYKLPNLIQNLIDHLLSNSVVPTGIVVSGIFFAGY